MLARAAASALSWLGWALLGLAALAGVALSSAALLATAPFARPRIAAAVVDVLDRAIAGRLELEGIGVLPTGAVELRGLHVYDPDEHLVLAVGRALATVDLTALRSRTVAVTLDLEAPSILLEEEEGGGTSLARAFAPSRPERQATPLPASRPREGSPLGGWTVHLSRLEIRRGDIWWVDAAALTRLEATGVDFVARGSAGPARADAEATLRAQVREPFEAPVALDVAAVLAGQRLRVPVLRASAGATSLEAVAEGDLDLRRGRMAVIRLGVSREQARELVPQVPAGADVAATGYAESDGSTLTAALRVEADGADGRGGRGDAAVAARLDALRRAAGFDVAFDRLDPSRLVAAAPPGALTLSARGALAGTSLEDGRARLALSIAPSRLRRGEISRAEVVLRAARGALEVNRLDLALPGLSLAASGTWRRAGAVAGTVRVDARDLARASRNLALLAGTKPPALAGQVRISAELSGSAGAPALDGTVDGPALGTGTLRAEGVRLAFEGTGPLSAMGGRVEGRLAALRRGGREIARAVALRASVQNDEGTLTATARVPGAGDEPMTFAARGRLGARRESLLLSELALSYPGVRWILVRPAAIDLRGPSVDRLELAAAPQRIAISGGLGRRGAIAVQVEASQVDLARLPPGVLPPEDGIQGRISATAEIRGTTARPLVDGKVALENGAFRKLRGLSASGEARLDGSSRRLVASLAAARADGGTAAVAVDVPLPLAGRPAERVLIRVKAAALPIPELLAAAGSSAPVVGTLAVEAAVEGTVGAPSLTGQVSVSDGAWQDLDGLAAVLHVDAPVEVARLTLSASRAGRRVLGAEAEVPLDVSDLLDHPAETVRALADARVEATLTLTALDLAGVAGHAGLPREMAGVLDGRAHVTGTRAAPQAEATFDVTGGAWREWRRLGAHLALDARDAGLAASGRITVGGNEALTFQASLGVRPGRLGERRAVLAAPLRVEAVVPRLALAAAGAEVVPLAGTIEGRLVASGTLRAPELTADFAGEGIFVNGRPLGDARATARYASRKGAAELLLRPTSGGTLRATLGVEGDLGIGAEGPARAELPAEATAVAEGLGLGFLPAIAPAVIRSASGQVDLDLRARGPLSRLSPRGTVRVSGGRVAVTEYGEWHDIALDARVTDDVVELSRLEVHRGRGRLLGSGAARGLRSEAATVSARMTADGFTVERAGMDFATFDLEAEATGTWRPSVVALEVSVPRGVIRLPKRSPRALQSLERRKDIVVGRKAERRRREALADGAASAAPPFTLTAHLVVPRNFFVKSDNPRADVELKADVRYELVGSQDYAEGAIEVIRGTVEPIAGRNFTLERGRIQFTGGPPRAALLDVEAKYVNPAAVVTVNVGGPATAPEIRLSSQPPMDDGQIAMLIATGRTELKAGSGAVGTLTGEEAGRAALGAVATQAFRNLVADKLPLDTVALDSGEIRAGKYVTDRIYVGYTRRFDADPVKGENENEVRVEYQISRRWMFESRYGNAQTGGASLIWSREY